MHSHIYTYLDDTYIDGTYIEENAPNYRLFYPQGKKTLGCLFSRRTLPTSGQSFDTVHLRNLFT